MSPDTKLPAQEAIDDLQAHVTSPEDGATLEDWQREVDADRQAAELSLGNRAIEGVKLVQLPDGSVATEKEVRDSQERGEERSGAYGSSGHR